ncbi:hypothetical protein [Micropruina sp.]|uniref:hypothetical protein n=1 Tax=Micropruina sp. TaxID=2737536 RepID=UPI0039E66A3C
MAPEVALAVVGDSTRPLRVLDPMCGSGTALALGVLHGHQVTGYDLDPLAILMAKVATQQVRINEVRRLATACLAVARRARATDARWSDNETREFARYWFGTPQRNQLVRLSSAINKLEPGPERNALQLSLSRLIVTKSPVASLAADTAHSRPHRVLDQSDYNVYEGFRASVASIVAALDARQLAGTARIQMGDARDTSLFTANAFDLVVTSPPYLNAIDYLRGHRLALIWFGYTLSELRAIRSVSIGSEAARRQDPTEANEDLFDRVTSHHNITDTRVRRLVLRYAHDMLELAGNIHRCLTDGGRIVLVVADSVLREERIPTGEIVRAALTDKGLSIESVRTREIPATLRYLPVSRAGEKLSRRMKHEYVITGVKAS